MKMSSGLTLLYLTIIAFAACGPSENNEQSDKENADSSKVSQEAVSMQITEEQKGQIVDLMQSLSPPIELSYLLSDIDLKFNSSILIEQYSPELYLSSVEKSQAMGMLSTDLVYCLVYSRTDLTKKYIQEIEQIATSLNLNSVIDFEKLNELSEQKINTQKLAMEFTAQMEKVITHLEKTNQLHLSAVISYSGWIESLYIASVVGKQTGTYGEELIDLVYYETIMAKSYSEIFSLLKEYPGYEVMLQDANNLSEMYSQIEVTLNKANAVVTYKDSVASAVSISTQELKLQKGQFDEIIELIKEIRKRQVK